MMTFELRDAAPEDADAIARLWHAGWHDGHDALAPAFLTEVRTLAEFQSRVPGILDEACVGIIGGALAGLCVVKGDTLDQMYVAPIGRGTGLAQALLANAEQRIGARGATRAVLKCAIGNERAAAFYRKAGWYLAGTITATLETAEGPYDLEVWEFAKAL